MRAALPDVPVFSATDAKGLEWDATLLIAAPGIVAQQRGWNGLYVALTRCTQELWQLLMSKTANSRDRSRSRFPPLSCQAGEYQSWGLIVPATVAAHQLKYLQGCGIATRLGALDGRLQIAPHDRCQLENWLGQPRAWRTRVLPPTPSISHELNHWGAALAVPLGAGDAKIAASPDPRPGWDMPCWKSVRKRSRGVPSETTRRR